MLLLVFVQFIILCCNCLIISLYTRLDFSSSWNYVKFELSVLLCCCTWLSIHQELPTFFPRFFHLVDFGVCVCVCIDCILYLYESNSITVLQGHFIDSCWLWHQYMWLNLISWCIFTNSSLQCLYQSLAWVLFSGGLDGI